MAELVKVVIVDDEKYASDSLSKLIQHYCPMLEIIGVADSVDSAYPLICEKKPALVFLDIHLTNQTSFTLIRKFEKIDFGIIFTSAHSNYGVPAFKVNAIDYLLKPIDCDDLISAVDKFLRLQELTALQEVTTKEELLQVHNHEKVELIPLKSIYYFEASDNYCHVVVENQKHYILSKTLKEVESSVEHLHSFIRIHRSILVNIHFILNYSKTQPSVITMLDGRWFEISRRKRTAILAQLKELKVKEIQ